MSIFNHGKDEKPDKTDRFQVETVILNLRSPEDVKAYIEHLLPEIEDDITRMELLLALYKVKKLKYRKEEIEKRLDVIAHRQKDAEVHSRSLSVLAEFKLISGNPDAGYRNLISALHTLDYIKNDEMKAELLVYLAQKATTCGSEFADMRFLQLIREKYDAMSDEKVRGETAYKLNTLSPKVKQLLGEKAGREWFDWSSAMVKKCSTSKKSPVLTKALILMKAQKDAFEKNDFSNIPEAIAKTSELRDAESRDIVFKELAEFLVSSAVDPATSPELKLKAEEFIRDIVSKSTSDTTRIEILAQLGVLKTARGSIKEAEDAFAEAKGALEPLEEGIIKDMAAGRLVQGIAKACEKAGSDYFIKAAFDILQSCSSPEVKANCYISIAKALASTERQDTSAIEKILAQAEQNARKADASLKSSLFYDICQAIVYCHVHIKEE
ncbi:MAG: hypothetical protein QW728_01905 [Thermoplasmata archaeon]